MADKWDGPLILAVDDDPDGRALVSALLAQVGYRVMVVASGEEALEAAATHPPDLVVLDVVLPGIDGFETCRTLKRHLGDSLPVLMLSGRGRKAVIEGLGAGADDYLPKPFDIDEFWARIDALLRIRAAEAAARRRAERLLSLQRLSAALAGRLEESEVVQLVLAEAQRLLDAHRVTLFTWDEDSGQLSPTRTVGAADRVPGTRRRGEGAIGQALEQRRPIWVNEYADWAEATPSSREQGVTAAVAAPLLLGDTVLGVIGALKIASRAQVDEEDAQLLGLLAGHAAAALNTARMYSAQSEAAARATERAAQLEAVGDSMADGLLMVDATGSITEVNRAAVNLLGVMRDRLLGSPLGDVLPPMCRPDGSTIAPRERALAAVLREGRSRVDSELVVEVGGRERIVIETTSPLRGPSGELLGAVSVFRDVTERRRAERRQVEAEKLRALGQMASGVAHDVNNMLTSVLGRAELARLELERGNLDPKRLTEALRLIEQAAEDGAQTVRRIQGYARLRRDTAVTVVDLAQIARDAVELTRPQWRNAAQATGRTIDAILDLDPHLFVAGEAFELREVLTNLILNAVDAMPRGGTITITGRRSGSNVCLDVADTGIGMSVEVRQRIFEPFFTTKAEAGNGLGLAVSFGIVQRRGGNMSVESVPSLGTTFTLELPLAEPPCDEPSPTQALATPSRDIMVVDDEPALASVLQRLLESDGHRVTRCTSGAEALELFDPGLHELVMTDLGMANINGLELAAAIRQRSPSTPVVLVTGWGAELDPDNPPDGISRVVAKPYRLARVLRSGQRSSERRRQ